MEQNLAFRKGHRERVRHRFLAEDFDAWEEYRMLELALFYAIPQKDVKEMAHGLIRHFHGLEGVFSASVEELCQYPGIGRHTAELLSCFSRVADLADLRPEEIATYRQASDIGEFITRYYETESHRCAVLLLFNNRFELLRVLPLEPASVSSPGMTPRLLTKYAYDANASMLAIGFHTEAPILLPSEEDYLNTRRLLTGMDALGITLLECVLCNAHRYAFLVKQSLGPKLAQRKERLLYHDV